MSHPSWGGSTVLKGIDLALTLRDVFINREPLALLGLVDFIPSSFLRGAGRVLSHLPGMGVVQRFGDDVGAWTKHIANRFIWTNFNGRRKLLLLSSSDPVVSALGSAFKSERFGSEVDEMIRNLKAHGIEIEFREGMMYSPAKGRPGKFIISKDASIAAWRHEYQHALDDIAANYPGLGPYFEDPVEHWLMEKRAYEVEIRTAMEFDVPEELVARIREAMENRKRELLNPDEYPEWYE